MAKCRPMVRAQPMLWDDGSDTMTLGEFAPPGGRDVRESDTAGYEAAPAWVFESALFPDGGTIGTNPSPHGGTWAYVVVDPYRDIRADCDSGTVAQGDFTDRPVYLTNNTAELYAAVLGLRSLPDGWEGAVYSDSQTTIRRLEKARDGLKNPMLGCPRDLVDAAYAEVKRVGQFRCVLIAGHPTKAELLHCQTQMVYRDPATGRAYSRHNHHADKLCNEAARDWARRL